MSKFNVGDKVVVREDLEIGKRYDLFRFVNSMARYRGQEAIITYIWKLSSSERSVYEIDIDRGVYTWTDSMLEHINDKKEDNDLNKDDLEENEMSKFNVGDKVIIRKDLKVGKSYNGDIFTSRMERYKGKEATVIIASREKNPSTYKLDIDDEFYFWTDDMLIPINEITSIPFDEGSLSIIMDSLKIAYTSKEEEINKLREDIKTMEEKCDKLSEEMVRIVKLQTTLNKQLIRKHNKENKENE